MGRADILKKLKPGHVVKEATEIIGDLENRLGLAVDHLNGKECPACGELSVVTGCSGDACVLCEYVHDIDGGAAG